MTSNGRVMLALGVSLLIWSPVALGVISGHIDLVPGAMYYLGALGISWVGTGVIMSLTQSYRATIFRVERAKREIEEIERRREYERSHRRADDKASDN